MNKISPMEESYIRALFEMIDDYDNILNPYYCVEKESMFSRYASQGVKDAAEKYANKISDIKAKTQEKISDIKANPKEYAKAIGTGAVNIAKGAAGKAANVASDMGNWVSKKASEDPDLQYLKKNLYEPAKQKVAEAKEKIAANPNVQLVKGATSHIYDTAKKDIKGYVDQKVGEHQISSFQKGKGSAASSADAVQQIIKVMKDRGYTLDEIKNHYKNMILKQLSSVKKKDPLNYNARYNKAMALFDRYSNENQGE